MTEAVADRVYIDQVRSLFSSVTASVIMSVIFLINAGLAYQRYPTSYLLAVGILGCGINLVRVICAAALRRRAFAERLDRVEARRLELYFSLPYVSFAAMMGLLGSYVFARSEAEMHMLTICVAVGYCAGVATNCGLRPRLAFTSIALAVGPVIATCLARGGTTYVLTAAIATAFAFGAARSMIVRFNESKAEIRTRVSSVSMARRDVLTGLPNRLALDEFFEGRLALSAPDTLIAVHYLDLNDFKPVNDRHGHAVGDQVLLAVAERLRASVRQSDMVARLGGDEFGIIQFGLRDAEEAYALSSRVAKAIQQPYALDQHEVAITTSVGTVVNTDRAISLAALLQLADADLYEAKRRKASPGLRIAL